MFRWQTLLGVALGLGIAALVLALVGTGRHSVLAGPLISEHDGRLREVVIQYEPEARDIVVPSYRDFLGWLGSDVTVHVVVPDRSAFDELAAAVGSVHCRLSPIVVDHPITTWSRDRWLALAPPAGSAVTTLWSPRGEALAGNWPERAGDQRIGFDISRALAPAVRAIRSALYFDGGDFLADSDNVFVMPRVLQRNIQNTVHDRAELLKILADEFKRHVVLLDEAPDYHAGMFMASAGNRTMLVGDPKLGRTFLPPTDPLGLQLLPQGGDFTPETQHLYDAVAAESEAAGYTVVRVPIVPAPDGRTFLTYVNCIMEQQNGKQIVYLPFYRGAESLNAAARAVWEKLGYEVRSVDCTNTYRHYGALHCLVNILTRVL